MFLAHLLGNLLRLLVVAYQHTMIDAPLDEPCRHVSGCLMVELEQSATVGDLEDICSLLEKQRSQMTFHADIILTLVLVNDTANGNVIVVGQLHQPQDEFLRLCDIIEVVQEVGHTINDYDSRTGYLNLVLDDTLTMFQALSSQVVTPELLMVALEFPA